MLQYSEIPKSGLPRRFRRHQILLLSQGIGACKRTLKGIEKQTARRVAESQTGRWKVPVLPQRLDVG